MDEPVKYYFRCPGCGNDTLFVKPSEDDDNMGCLFLVFGGLLSALLFTGYNRGRIQCQECKHLFQQPAIPSSPYARYVGVIVGMVIVLICVSVFFFCLPSLAKTLPSFPFLFLLEDAIVAQPRVAAYLLISLSLITVVPLWVAATIANARYRKKFRSQYSYKVPSLSKYAAVDSAPGADIDKAPDDGSGPTKIE